MVYLPEHTVDLQTGVIVQAQVLAGDHRDSEDLSARVIEAVVSVQEAQGTTDPEAVPQTLTADKGYFSLEEIGRLQELTLKTVISDPRRAQRRLDKLSSDQRKTLARAQRSVSSKYGKGLLRKRGQHIERSFAHVLDAGGMRRTTLRGLEKSEQTPSDRGGLLQSLPTPAPALRSGNSEAVGGLFCRGFPRFQAPALHPAVPLRSKPLYLRHCRHLP